MKRLQRRPRLLTALAAVLIVAAAYLLFELGRYQAGYAVLDTQRRIEAYESAAAAADRTIDELKRRIAVLETSSDIDHETYARVESSLADLEAKLQVQEEELAFYRGIISPPDGVAGLRIQSLEVESAGSELSYTVRLVLMQAIVHNQRVSGIVRLRVAGMQDGEETALGLEELTPDGLDEIEYGFRYFQGLEQEIELPEGLEPETVDIEIRPAEPRGEPMTQSFQWATIAGEDAR